MAEEQSSNPDVTTDNTDPASNPDVKTDTNNPSNSDVKTGDGVTDPNNDQESKIPTTTFGDFVMPTNVFRDLQKNNFAEANRKQAKEWEKAGRLKTDDEMRQMQFASELLKSVGKTYNPDKEDFTTTEIQEMVKQHTQSNTSDLQSKVKDANLLLEKAQQDKEIEVLSLKTKLVYNDVYQEVNGKITSDDKQMFHPKFVKKAVRDVLALNEFLFSEDGNIVVKGSDGNLRYNKGGDYMTVEEVVTEYANSEDSDCFKSGSLTGGAGGGYSNGKPDPKNEFIQAVKDSLPKKALKVNLGTGRSFGNHK